LLSARHAIRSNTIAVTAQIKALEKELGVPLFDRICSASSYAQEVLPGILLKFLTQHPGVNVTVKISDFLEDTTARLARGELDLLACLDESDAHPGFAATTKKSERVVFVTHPDNPLLKQGKVALEEAVSSQFIVADRDISYCAVLEKQLRRRGVEFRPAMEIGSVGAIVNMLLRGFGVSFLPEFAVSKYLQTGELARLDTEDIDIELYSYLIYSRDRWLNPVMKEFIRIAGESQKER
jgi:DNA-binding transcriptional LysR family regulator